MLQCEREKLNRRDKGFFSFDQGGKEHKHSGWHGTDPTVWAHLPESCVSPSCGVQSLMGESGHGVRCQADGWRVNGSSKHLSNTCNVSSIVLFWVFLPVQYWQHVISSVLLQCPCRKGNWGTQKLRTRFKLTHIVRVENRIWIQAVRLPNLHF